MRPLKLHSVDSGYCRVYYRSETGRIYCFQGIAQFDLYYCTPDGEPEDTVTLCHSLDKLPEPTCSTSRDFIDWAADQDKESLCLLK